MASTKEGGIIFRDGGVAIEGVTGASDITTDSINLIEFNSPWILYLLSTHNSGTPKVTVQCSDDNANWFDYKADSTDVLISETIIDGEYLPKYMRLVYTANSSDGNITFLFSKISS